MRGSPTKFNIIMMTLRSLDGIPGVNRRSAEFMLAEMGTPMDRFPTHRHLASWSGISPGNDESVERYSGNTRKVNQRQRLG